MAPEEVRPQQLKGPTDDESLVRFLRERSKADGDLRRLPELLRQLGDDDFEKREWASRKLVALDRAAVAGLQRRLKSKDIEVQRRAMACLRTIEKATPERAPLAVVGLLAKKKPAGALGALLRYLPYATTSEVEEAIYYAVDALAVKDGRTSPELLKALADPLPARRALAGCVVGRVGTAPERASVRKLFRDANAEVRLRAAQGLLAGKDASGLGALVALLPESPAALAWQAEELLHYVAGPDAPKAVVGKATPGEREKCRAEWALWLKDKAAAINLAAVEKTNRRPGLILTFENPTRPTDQREIEELAKWKGRLSLCGCDGQPRCQPYTVGQFAANHLPVRGNARSIGSGHDGLGLAWRLGVTDPKGEEPEWVFITEETVTRYVAAVENSRRLKVVEKKRKQKHIVGRYVARLGNGNRLMAIGSKLFAGIDRIVELDRADRVLWETAARGPLCGLVVWPLVRVGFAPRAATADLDAPMNRTHRLKHRDPIVRRLSADLLAKAPRTEGIIDAAVAALDDPDRETRTRVVNLFLDAQPHAQKGIPKLVRLLGAPDQEVHWVREALWQCKAAAVPALLKAFENKPKEVSSRRGRQRVNAIGILALFVGMRDPRVWRVLNQAFDDPDPNVRREVGVTLCCCEERGRFFVPKIARLLKDPDRDVRTSVVSALDFLGRAGVGEEAVPALLRALDKPELRSSAIRSVASVGSRDPRVFPALRKLATPKQEIQTCLDLTSAFELFKGTPNAKEAVSLLCRMLKDERASPPSGEKCVQSAAISALGAFGAEAKPALPLLLQLGRKDAPDGKTRVEVIRALEKIDPRAAEELKPVARPVPRARPPVHDEDD
jgi:HEAT repeat protein